MSTCKGLDKATRSALVTASLNEAQARELFREGEEAVVFALLTLAKQLAEAQGKAQTSPAAPSGMIPVYEKPPAKQRGKRPGAKSGHPGSRRPPPERIDWQAEHRADNCPECGGRLQQCADTRTRYTEDIPDIQPEVTEHTIHRDWCPQCKKKVESPVVDALPVAQLGNRVLVLSAWLHYALGNTLSQIVEVFNFHLQMKLSEGGLIAMWQRLQAILFAWYEEIQQEALQSAVLHGDETGWRVSGKTHWLWCFGNRQLTYFMIDRSRGSPALQKFFTEEFQGTLVTDFWARTTRSPAATDRCAWCICCANWNRRKNTNRPANTGRHSPKSCAACWGMRFGCGASRRSCPRERMLRAVLG